MCRTVQQALETVYTHGVSVPHVSDCTASTGNCVYTRGLCPCETVRQAPENVYVHHVWVHIGQPIKHCKQCIHTGLVSLLDCPASTGKCKCTPCLGSYRTAYKALQTVRHGVTFPVRLSGKHRKMCMYTMSGFISDCPSSTGNCVITRGQCPCQTVQQALYTVCTQRLGSYLAVLLSIKPRRLLAHRIWHTVLNQERNARSLIRAYQRPQSTAPGVTMKDKRTREGRTMNLMIINLRFTDSLFLFLFLINKNECFVCTWIMFEARHEVDPRDVKVNLNSGIQREVICVHGETQWWFLVGIHRLLRLLFPFKCTERVREIGLATAFNP